MRTRLLAPLCMMAAMAIAQVSHVVPPGTPGNTPNPAAFFNTWTNAATNIQAAVNAAFAAGWTNVWVSNGTYRLTNQIIVANAMVLRSWNNGALDRDGTMVDGNYPDFTNRCFWLAHPQAVLRGLTITNGYATGGAAIPDQAGGGVYITNGATLDDCLITGNASTYYGGGVFVDGSRLINCDIVANRSINGGGVSVRSGGWVSGTIIGNNEATTGGGIYLAGGAVSNCTVVSNIASTRAGGIYAVGGQVLDVRVLANRGYVSGGLDISAGTARHCTITGNIATRTTRGSGHGGAGLRIEGATTLAESCVIANNTAMGVGGGVNVNGGTVRNCQIIGNSALSCSAADYYNGGGVFYYGPGLVENCVIISNYAVSTGGGVVIWDQVGAVLRNCLVAENHAATNAAGVYIYRGTSTLENCAITANLTQPGGATGAGGLAINTVAGNILGLVNSVLYGNTNAGGTYSNIYGNAGAVGVRHITNSCVAPMPIDASFAVTNSFAHDPILGAGGRPRAGSPCINAGVYRTWMAGALDLDGRRRIDRFSGLVDVGCHEYISHGTLFYAQ